MGRRKDRAAARPGGKLARGLALFTTMPGQDVHRGAGANQRRLLHKPTTATHVGSEATRAKAKELPEEEGREVKESRGASLAWK